MYLPAVCPFFFEADCQRDGIGLAIIVVPESDSLLHLAVLEDKLRHPSLLYQQHIQLCCGRSRLLLQLFHESGWATVPIWEEQVRCFAT